MSSVMLPVFPPEEMIIDKLLWTIIGIIFFESAYMAEVVRGGLQAIPRGQYKAAEALGLSYWKTIHFSRMDRL
jgi:general L-amino acid transport system permease protein